MQFFIIMIYNFFMVVAYWVAIDRYGLFAFTTETPDSVV